MEPSRGNEGSLATAQSLIFRLLNRLVAGSRGAAHIAGIELLPEVRRDKAFGADSVAHETASTFSTVWFTNLRDSEVPSFVTTDLETRTWLKSGMFRSRSLCFLTNSC